MPVPDGTKSAGMAQYEWATDEPWKNGTPRLAGPARYRP
jgi:hypothetical protein